MSASGFHPNGATLDWTVEIEPRTALVRIYAQLSNSSSTRIRYTPADLDALIAVLVAMKEVADRTAAILAPLKLVNDYGGNM